MGGFLPIADDLRQGERLARDPDTCRAGRMPEFHEAAIPDRVRLAAATSTRP